MTLTDEEVSKQEVENDDTNQEEQEEHGKRKRGDSTEAGDDEEVLKKLKPVEDYSDYQTNGYGSYASSAPKTTETADGMMIEVSQDKVGQIIGSKGAIIQEIQMRSGAKAFINQDFPDGANRQVNLTGTPQQVKTASDLINLIIEQGPQAIHTNSIGGGTSITSIMDCSQDDVGKVIGTKGATIKELQSKSGARIQIDQDFPSDAPRKINITGSAAAVAIAAQLITTVMTQGAAAAGLTGGGGGNNFNGGFGGGGGGGNHYGGGGMGQPYGQQGGGMYGQQGGMYGGGMMGQQPYGQGGMGGGAMGGPGGEGKQQMDVPKSIVGKIIGRGGETIGMIQRKSGARVQVEQNVPEGTPCKIMMSGSPQALQAATTLIQEIIMSAPDGRQAFGGMMPTPVPVAGGGAPGGYGMPQMQQQPYGMQGAYGMPMQQPQYGAYGGYPQQQSMGAAPYGQAQPQYGMPAGGGYQAYGAAAAGVAPVAGAYGQPAAYGAPAVVAAPKVATPAVVWTEHKTDDGITYWYNASTGVSQ
eukprot:gene30353-37555_t